MVWNKPPKQEIDGWFYTFPLLQEIEFGVDWEKLGNKGWNWDNLAKYSAKSASSVFFFFPMRIELIRLKSTAAGYRFIPAPLSADEAARRGLGPGSGWDKAFGHGISS